MNEVLQVAAKAVIINSKGEVLVVREPAKNNPGSQHGLYGIPGGRMDSGENYEQALQREVREETGLEVNVLYPLYVGEWSPVIKGQKCHIVAIFSVCEAQTTDVELSEEHDDYKWIKPDEVKTLSFMPPDDQVIARYARWSGKGLTP